MISILDYEMGNVRSIQNALNYIGVENKVIDTKDKILESEKIILPGVGSFRKAMENIEKKNFINPLEKAVFDKKTPILGICLGMQLLAEESEEDGITKGLGWINGTFKKFHGTKLKIKVPHVGFNEVFLKKNNYALYNGLREKTDFYYVHSYRMAFDECNCISGWTEYGEKFVASIEKENIYGVQFHPEKSQSNGLLMLKNFAEL